MSGKIVKLNAERYKGIEIMIQALFLKNKKQLESIIARREKQLDDLIGKPAEQPAPETIQKNITIPSDKNKQLQSDKQMLEKNAAETQTGTTEKK